MASISCSGSSGAGASALLTANLRRIQHRSENDCFRLLAAVVLLFSAHDRTAMLSRVNMRVIHSPLHARHDGGIELHRGELVPSFEMPARVAYILSALERAAMPVEPPREFAPQALLRVHDAGFVDFLRSAYAQWRAAGMSGSMLPSGFPARGLRRDRIPAGINGMMGYYAFDAGTPIVEGTWDAALASAQSALTAAALVAEGERCTFALCRPPGHHAGHSTYGGYCFLNNAALAA